MIYGLSPLALLVLGGLLLWLGTRRRAVRGAGAVLWIVGWLGCTPFVANRLAGALEADAEADRSQCADAEAVVLLSGGLARPPRDAGDVGALGPVTVQRVAAFVQRDDGTLPLLISGGGRAAVSEAAIMATLLRALAPARDGIRIEEASTTTWENAEQVAHLLPPPRRIALATSALHLPRARRAFEHAGYAVCPWALDRQFIDAGGLTAWLPHATAARKTEAVLHEIAGGIVYRWRMRESRSTDS